MAYSLLHEYVAINVEALQGEETITEMHTILHTVNTSIADTLVSKFVTLKTKNLVTQMLGDGSEDCKRFYQQVEGV
jgi:hypothetical protein